MKRIMFTIISVTFSSILFAQNFVDFNDGGQHIIDYRVQYTPENPDCGVRIDYNVNNDPGTAVTVKTEALIYETLWAYNNSSVNMEGGDVWGGIRLMDFATLKFTDGISPNVTFYGHSSGIIDGGISGIWVNDEARLTILNATLNDFYSYGNAITNIYNTLYSYRVVLLNYSVMNIYGGIVQGCGIMPSDYSILHIYGGDIGTINSSRFAKIVISGGRIAPIYTQDFSVAEVEGNFHYMKPHTSEYSENNYYGSLANLDVSEFIEEPTGNYWKGRLKGTFKNGDNCEFDYRVFRTNPDWTCDITIVPAENIVTVLSPNGSEYINVGSVYPITWQSYGNIEQVLLEYSLDNGQIWNFIETVPNTGSYDWQVPMNISSQCLIRASDTTHPETFDVSDAVFSIGNPLVYFADANLKAAVELALGVSNPTASDMLKLTYLNAKSKGITSLVGLETALNLTTLYLHQNSISDISPLTGLNKLTVLNLYLNNLTDISPLSGLTKLYSLAISSNKISDIHPLSGMVNLIYLYINNNQINDFSTLTGNTKFKEIYATRNAVLTKETYLNHIPMIRGNNPSLTVFQYDPGCSTFMSGDVNQDCHVNLLDLAIIASNWLKCNHIYEEMCP